MPELIPERELDEEKAWVTNAGASASTRRR
jgi:hypothetical protein